jgi:hypothetical protein
MVQSGKFIMGFDPVYAVRFLFCYALQYVMTRWSVEGF